MTHRGPFQPRTFCDSVMSHIYASLPPVCTSMANEENYPNRASFHSQTENLFFTSGRKCGREPTSKDFCCFNERKHPNAIFEAGKLTDSL